MALTDKGATVGMKKILRSLKGEETGKSGIRGKTDGTDKGGNKPAYEIAGRRQRRTVGFNHITREVFIMRIGNNSQGIWQFFSRMNGNKTFGRS